MAFDPDAYIKSFEQKPTDKQSAPAFDPDEYIKGLEERLAEERKPKKAEDVGIIEGTLAAFKRGFSGVGESGSGLSLAKSKAFGEMDEARQKMEDIKKAQAEEDRLPALTSKDIERLYNEQGILSAVSNVPKYITENVAQSIPQMFAPQTAGVIASKINPTLGALVGIGTYGIQQFGNFLVTQAQVKDSPEELDLTKAALTATGTAPLGFMTDKFTLGIGSLGKNAGAEIVKELSARELAAKVGKRVATGATQGVIAEAPVEVLETAAELYQAGLSLNDDAAKDKYREAFFGAAAAGGAIGGASRGISALREKPTEVPPEVAPPIVPPESQPVLPPEGVNPPLPGEPIVPPVEPPLTPPPVEPEPIKPPVVEPVTEPPIEPPEGTKPPEAPPTPPIDILPTDPQKVSPPVELAPGESVNPDLFQINKPYEQIAKEVTGMNVPQISNWAVQNAPNDFAKYIAEKVEARIKDFEKIGVPMTLAVQHGKDRRGSWYGMVQSRVGYEMLGGKSSYEMNLKGLDKSGKADSTTGTRYSTILHELIHVSTIAQLGRLGQQAKDANTSAAFDELKGILNKVRAQIRIDSKNPDRHQAVQRINSGWEYTKDTDELIAYGFTDPIFQHYLSTVKMGNKSAFDKFVEIIQKLLGIKREYKSALEALVKATDTIYKPTAKEIQSEMNKKGYNFGKSAKPTTAKKPSSYATIEDEIRTNKAPPVDSPAFKNWFKDSKIVDENGNPQIVYHGTKKDFFEFKTQYKDGLFFFSTSPQFASKWPVGTGGLREPSEEIKQEYERIKEFETSLRPQYMRDDYDFNTDEGRKLFDEDRARLKAALKQQTGYDSAAQFEMNAGIQVMPVYLSIQKPFDPRVDHKKIEQFLIKAGQSELVDKGYHKSGNWLVYENHPMIEELKRQGYDGIWLAENVDGPHETIAAFRPNQIKSATGNAGSFLEEVDDIRFNSYQNETPENTNQDTGLIKTETPKFKKWFGDSKIVDANGKPIVMYHGTAYDIEKFIPGEANAIFLTFDPIFADKFSKLSEKQKGAKIFESLPWDKEASVMYKAIKIAEEEGIMKGEELQKVKDTVAQGELPPNFYISSGLSDVIDQVLGAEGGENTLPVYVKAENPFDYEKREDREKILNSVPPEKRKKLLAQTSYDREHFHSALRYGNWEFIEKSLVQDAIKNAGFDSFYVKEGNHKNLAVYKPNQVKSAIGNSGAYSEYVDDIRFNSYQNETPQAQWHGPTESKIDGLIYKLQDKHIDTKRVIQAIEKTGKKIEDDWNVYLKEELYHGRTSAAIRKFLLQDILPTVKQMSRMGITPDDLKTYMHNLHAEERNAQIAKINPEMPDKGSGISTKDAQEYLAKLDPKKKAKLEELSNKFQDMVKGTQDVLVKSGAETQQTIDAWNNTYKNYVPLFRVDDDFATHPSQAGTGQGLSSRGGFSKRAMGSEKGVQDILGNIIAQRERALIRAEKIRVGRAMYGLAIQNPNPDFWLPVNPDLIKDPDSVARELTSLGLDGKDIVGLMMEPKNRYIYKDPRTGLETVALRVNPLERYKDSVFPVRVDGQDRYIFFNANDPRANRMVEAMKNLDAEQLGAVEGLVGKATRWFSAVNTQYNPVFGGINLLRDVQGAIFNLTTTKIAGEQAKVTAGVFPAMRGIFATLRAERSGEGLPNNEWATLWADFKEQGGQTLYRDSLARKAEEDQIIDQELKKLKSNNLKKAFIAAANMLSDFNDTIENSVRLSAYKVALDKGLSKEQAASIAKNLTVNFDRKGQVGSRINALYAFFNASMQGSARLVETLKGPKGRKIIAGGILLGSAQAIAMAAAGFDEDEPPEFIKERNLIIPLPDKKYLMIPMPLGLHLLPNLGRITTEFVMNGGKEPGKHASSLLGVTMDAFNPIGGSGTALEMVAPTVLDPLVAIGTNKDAFGRPIYKEDRATNPTPGYLRSREGASEISKLMSQFLNYASGGTEYQKGMFSPTADEIDYLAGQITGGAGREIMKTEQAIKSAITGEELPSYRIPLAGRFYGEGESQAADSQRFYQNVTRMANHENEIKGRAKNKGNVAEYMRENPEAKLWQMANDSENQISALNKQKKEFIARNFPKEKIVAIDKQKQMVMKRFNDKGNSLED